MRRTRCNCNDQTTTSTAASLAHWRRVAPLLAASSSCHPHVLFTHPLARCSQLAAGHLERPAAVPDVQRGRWVSHSTLQRMLKLHSSQLHVRHLPALPRTQQLAGNSTRCRQRILRELSIQP